MTILATAPVSADADLSTLDTAELPVVLDAQGPVLDADLRAKFNDPYWFPIARTVVEDIGRKYAAKFVDDIDLVVGFIYANRVAVSMNDAAADAFAAGMRQALEHRMQSGRRPVWPGQAKTFVEVLDALSEAGIDRCMDQRGGSPHPDPADYQVLEDVEAAMCPPPRKRIFDPAMAKRFGAVLRGAA